MAGDGPLTCVSPAPPSVVPRSPEERCFKVLQAASVTTHRTYSRPGRWGVAHSVCSVQFWEPGCFSLERQSQELPLKADSPCPLKVPSPTGATQGASSQGQVWSVWKKCWPLQCWWKPGGSSDCLVGAWPIQSGRDRPCCGAAAAPRGAPPTGSGGGRSLSPRHLASSKFLPISLSVLWIHCPGRKLKSCWQ